MLSGACAFTFGGANYGTAVHAGRVPGPVAAPRGPGGLGLGGRLVQDRPGGLRPRQRAHCWGGKPKGGLRQAAGPGEWRRLAVMRGSAALPVVVPARAPRPERTVPCPRQRGCRPRADRRTAGRGHRGPTSGAPAPAPAPAQVPAAGGSTASSADDLHAAAGLSHSPGPAITGTGLSGFPPE